jgi:hypothetical protein
MATRTRSKSPKRAASRSRSHSKKAHKRAHSKKSMRRRSASKKSMRRRSASKKSVRKSVRRMTKKSRATRRVNAYANFRKMHWKQTQAAMPGASFAQLSRAIAAMWKKAGSKTKSAVRKMMRSPRKARKMRVSKKRAMKKSGSPRKARKDKGTKGRKANAYAMFVKKYFAAKRAALGGDAKPKMVMKALGHDWKQGVRHY